VSAVGAVGAVRNVEAGSSSVWGENQLVFQKLRVEEVVSRFNRRNRLQIRVADKELAARVVSGVFAADDPASFIEFLTTVADARSRKTAPDEIVIEPRAGGTGRDPGPSPAR
jgi:ferric-dicitrate binding protein FerR (iron transport regulator)